ncbi:outer membrane murein-binding lipoprotein Lpp [Croceifilum oryzae]|uniref:Outer membrane murein-binding lipoprotein Lpp n=1 Tax=Croceifilum oryzae TaxID=1553429 RepID=A0AAJ1TNC3_9BACL|nr:hypothetical protein [Croceifilum oryzae]MDQ0417930.1 outer membrane murein-binding lipoprotein Lpp [Croceifilum oryzae]
MGELQIQELVAKLDKLDERLGHMQTDLAVIREKQSNEVYRLQLDIERLEMDSKDIRQDVKQLHEKISNRDRLLVSTLLAAGLGLFVWLIQRG